MDENESEEELKEGFYFDFERGPLYFTGTFRGSYAICNSPNGSSFLSPGEFSDLIKIPDIKKFIEQTEKDMAWAKEQMNLLESLVEKEEPGPLILDPNIHLPHEDWGPFGKNPYKKGGDPPHPYKKY